MWLRYFRSTVKNVRDLPVHIWSARLAGMAMALFLALFALDAFEGSASLRNKVLHMLIHLWPSGLLALVIVLAWRRPMIGLVAFLLLAFGYAVWAWDHPQWVLVISGPLVVVAMLYAWSSKRTARA